MPLRKASWYQNIPLTSLSNHFIDKVTLRKCGPLRVLLIDEEAVIVEWVFGIHKCGLSMSLHQLKLKVGELTQTHATPFNNGIPRTSQWHQFKRRHPEISVRLAKGLDISKAQGLTQATCYTTNRNIFQTTYGIVMKLVFSLVGNLAHECLQKEDPNKSIRQYQSQGNG